MWIRRKAVLALRVAVLCLFLSCLIYLQRFANTADNAKSQSFETANAKINTHIYSLRLNQRYNKSRDLGMEQNSKGSSYANQTMLNEIYRMPDFSKRIWPEEAPDYDRIPEQMMYIPEKYDLKSSPMKHILIYNVAQDSWAQNGQKTFIDSECLVDKCRITMDMRDAEKVDAIIFRASFGMLPHNRTSKQIWILYQLECPYHTSYVTHPKAINWTATYRRDSDLVAPYERWMYFDPKVTQLPQSTNYARNKTEKVAWFVSNCSGRNKRLAYAKELGKYISVHIYGQCGPYKCPRTAKCFSILDDKYKFYLAFENSNCVDYITEKFFVNGLQHNIIPIVMGARKEDYEAVAPYNSFIHVDDFESPKELAEYLHKLDQNDDLYNEYLKWKGTGQFINTKFFCRLCALLHDDHPSRSYEDINEWLRAKGTCIPSGKWKDYEKYFEKKPEEIP